jgi:hypothetical protein
MNSSSVDKPNQLADCIQVLQLELSEQSQQSNINNDSDQPKMTQACDISTKSKPRKLK